MNVTRSEILSGLVPGILMRETGYLYCTWVCLGTCTVPFGGAVLLAGRCFWRKQSYWCSINFSALLVGPFGWVGSFCWVGPFQHRSGPHLSSLTLALVLPRVGLTGLALHQPLVLLQGRVGRGSVGGSALSFSVFLLLLLHRQYSGRRLPSWELQGLKTLAWSLRP